MGPIATRGRLRVLTLIDDVALTGGGERMARQLAVQLDPDRFVRVLCSTRWSARGGSDPQGAAAVHELEGAGVRFIGLKRRSALSVGAWRPLIQLMRRERIDILHAHMFGSNVWGAVLSTALRVPVFVAHEHTWSYEGRPLRRFLDRELIARRADAFVAVSEADRRRMIEVEGVDPSVIVPIPNAILPHAPPSGRDARPDFDIPPDAPVVGTVCSLRAQKALPVLVEAAAILRRDFPALRVLIVGDGPERMRLDALIRRSGLDDCVTLAGDRTDVPDQIQAFDVAVCSSDFEGMPLSVMEYMEAGKPVVSTRVGGVPELVADGVEGLMVEPQAPAALAAAVGELLGDRERAAEMGRRGRERAAREFGMDRMVRRFERLYEDLYAASS